MAEVERALPADAIVVDESITASIDLARVLIFEGPGDYFGARGGGIGQALPGALGVKLAHPRRPVVAISGDGSAMYSIQALWTAAHHALAVVFVILDNREYRILKHNMDAYRQRFGVKDEGRPYAHMDLTEPDISFVDIARGMGVAAARVTPARRPRSCARHALGSGKPYVLDVAVEGSGSATLTRDAAVRGRSRSLPCSSTTSTSARQFRKMRELVPEAYRAFLEFDQKAFKDGAIPAKMKELIAAGHRPDHPVPVVHRRPHEEGGARGRLRHRDRGDHLRRDGHGRRRRLEPRRSRAPVSAGAQGRAGRLGRALAPGRSARLGGLVLGTQGLAQRIGLGQRVTRFDLAA